MIVLTKDYNKYWIVDCHNSTRKEEFVSQNYIFLGMYAQLRSRVPQDDCGFQVWYKLLCENNHRVLFDISTQYKSKRKIV